MEFKREIPARVELFRAKWCKREFTTVSPTYRKIRGQIGGGLLECFMCDAGFIDGDKIALAYFEGHGNEALCQKCADKLIGDKP